MRQREKLRQAARGQSGIYSANPNHPLNVSRAMYRCAKDYLRLTRECGDRPAESQALNLCKEIKPVLQQMAERTRTALAVRQAQREWDEHFVNGAA